MQAKLLSEGQEKTWRVRPTLEVMRVESPCPLQRKYDPESGIALIAPAAS